MNVVQTQSTQQQLLIPKMAHRFGMERETFEAVMKNTIMPANATNAETVAFLAICDRYGLDPFLKHIHCFFDKRTDRIMPIISIDGWSFMVNQHPQYDGVEFDYMQDGDGKTLAITCRMYRKDRARPTVITEFMAECWKNTDAWNKTPARFLRHRAFMQCARICFGFSGIDEEQALELNSETIEAQAFQPVEQRQAEAPRPPSPKKAQTQVQQQTRQIQQTAQQAMGRIDDREGEFDPLEVQGQTQAQQIQQHLQQEDDQAQQQQEEQAAAPKRTRRTKAEMEAARQQAQQPAETQQTETRQQTQVNPQNALDAFTVAIGGVTSIDDLEELIEDSDIRAVLTHDDDRTALLEALIAKVRRRLS